MLNLATKHAQQADFPPLLSDTTLLLSIKHSKATTFHALVLSKR